jgi:hypothetical protein
LIQITNYIFWDLERSGYELYEGTCLITMRKLMEIFNRDILLCDQYLNQKPPEYIRTVGVVLNLYTNSVIGFNVVFLI